MPLFDIQAELRGLERITDSILQLNFSAPEITQFARPGQFVMLRCGNGNDPLLRRPFSIHRISSNGLLQLLIRVVGKGTNWLAELRVGKRVSMLGPLGNGFDLSLIDEHSPFVAVVGGGMGVAPLLFLADQLALHNHTKQTEIILGARIQAELLCLTGFRELGFTVQCITDDGSSGERGFVSDILHRNLTASHRAVVFSCGPVPMLKAVSTLCELYSATCQVSLETHMACGISACLGCALPAKNAQKEFVHVCKDGPVFNSREIAWHLI